MEAKEVGKWKNGGSEFEPGIIVCACHSHDHAIIYNKFEDINNIYDYSNQLVERSRSCR